MTKQPSRSLAPRALLLLSACVLGALGLTAPAGCFLNKDDPAFCEGRPNGFCACQSSDECSGSLAICDVGGTDTCVECTADSAAACTGTRPLCGDDNTCQGCGKHADCSSAVCLPDGACATEETVAYVAADGMGTMCTKTAPCGTLGAALLTEKPYIKAAAGMLKDNKSTLFDGKAVTIFADAGTKVDRDGDGPILEVRSANTDVKLYDLEIGGASGAIGADAILMTPNGGVPKLALTRVKLVGNQGLGISASGGVLAVSQSTISGNTGGGISLTGGSLVLSQSTLASNANGGVSLTSSTFDITNSFFFANGGQASIVGGLSITTTQNAANRLEFNSFNKNQTQDGVAPAIQCVAGTFTARNNLMSGNGTLTQLTQFGGACAHAYSVATPGPVPAGTGNLAVDPMFLDVMKGDLHLSPGSPVRGMADPASSLLGQTAVDIDGQPRTSPADIGADEVP